MATITTGIQLADNFSAPLMHIVSSVNLVVSQIYDMNQAMNLDVDTASLEGARNEINQVAIAAKELQQTMQNVNMGAATSSPLVNQTIEPVQQPVQWQSDGFEVFNNSGVERWEQEIQSANHMLEQLNNTQAQIAQQASSMEILDPNAASDLTQLGSRMQSVQDRIQQMENNQINIGTDVANAELEQLRSQLNKAIGQQDELN